MKVNKNNPFINKYPKIYRILVNNDGDNADIAPIWNIYGTIGKGLRPCYSIGLAALGQKNMCSIKAVKLAHSVV